MSDGLDIPFSKDPQTIQDWLRVLIQQIDDAKRENTETKQLAMTILERVVVLEDAKKASEIIEEAFAKKEEQEMKQREEDRKENDKRWTRITWIVSVALSAIIGLLTILAM